MKKRLHSFAWLALVSLTYATLPLHAGTKYTAKQLDRLDKLGAFTPEFKQAVHDYVNVEQAKGIYHRTGGNIQRLVLVGVERIQQVQRARGCRSGAAVGKRASQRQCARAILGQCTGTADAARERDVIIVGRQRRGRLQYQRIRKNHAVGEIQIAPTLPHCNFILC